MRRPEHLVDYTPREPPVDYLALARATKGPRAFRNETYAEMQAILRGGQ